MSILENQPTEDHALLIRETMRIAEALSHTFAPFCEVVVHDLHDPNHTVVQISNNLSGRKVGDPATEMGLARMADREFPDQVVNYKNTLPDGRTVKSTSIGIKDSQGQYAVALCLNVDISVFERFSGYLQTFTAVSEAVAAPAETLSALPFDLTAFVEQFSYERNKSPRELTPADKEALMAKLRDIGVLKQRGAIDRLADILGSSRGSLYYYLKKTEVSLDL